ncbi:hypothetical protein MFRU_004g02210 [Monilinia fructicola]|nr:hypothetical protein MFRU_004g02210 [Monilinia fructicola]
MRYMGFFLILTPTEIDTSHGQILARKFIPTQLETHIEAGNRHAIHIHPMPMRTTVSGIEPTNRVPINMTPHISSIRQPTKRKSAEGREASVLVMGFEIPMLGRAGWDARVKGISMCRTCAVLYPSVM